MKDYANLVAVGGVVLLGVGTLIYYGFTGQQLDPAIINNIASGLIGFAGGAGAAYLTNKVSQ